MAEDGDVIITVRMLMVGKEIGGIIGKGGANITSFREESGAKITISAAQASPERIVTITGAQSQIKKAVHLITEKMHKDINSGLSSAASNKVPVTIRLIVPASQCGSIIGKGGSKIKEIRDTTGCSIQVQSEMLPNSSERTVTLSGAPTTIIHCINMLCDVMIQFPAKTATVPYKPQGGAAAPVIFHEGQAYLLQGQYAGNDVPYQHSRPRSRERNRPVGGFGDAGRNSLRSSPSSSIDNIAASSSGTANFPVRILSANTQELIVNNELVGCIIGKGGSRINEIRMLSGAQIKISHMKDEEEPEAKDDKSDSDAPVIERKIMIAGTPEAISLAQYLINLSVQMFSSQDKPPGSSGFHLDPAMAAQSASGRSPLMGSSGLASLLGQPPGLLGASSFGASSLLGSALGTYGAALQTARRSLISRNRSGPYRGARMRSGNGSRSPRGELDFTADVQLRGDSPPNGKEKRKQKREKFQPY